MEAKHLYDHTFPIHCAAWWGRQVNSGLGNILFNGFISPAQKTNRIFHWGLGPAVQLPTRTDPLLGSNTICAGPSALLYLTGSELSGGIVAQNFWSLGGTGTNKVNMLSVQYIIYYNLPKGWILESNASITADWKADPKKRWTVPLGGGPGKTFKAGKLYYAATLQAFYNAVKPETVGNWMVTAQFQVILSQ